MAKPFLILPYLVKSVAAALTASTAPGQTLTASNYVGYPAAGSDYYTTVRVGKPQVPQSCELMLVDLSTQPFTIIERSLDGSPLLAHDTTHSIETFVTPSLLKGLVQVYDSTGTFVANVQGLSFGDGLQVDSSDPTRPVVSLDVPSPAVGTDAIWDAKGDLAAGTGADTAQRLAVGTDGQFLTADSGATTGLAWADGSNSFSDAEGDPADVAAAADDGDSAYAARRNHVHGHGSGYLPDAHHARSHDHSSASDDDALSPASLDVTAGPVTLSGTLTPAQLTASTDDYDPADLATSTVLRLDTDGDYNLTGLAGGVAGRVLELLNVGANTLTLTAEDAASTATNRFAFDADLALPPNTSALVQYDGTSTRWRLVGFGKVSASNTVGGDTLWDAKGDLAVGTAADTAQRLAVGTDGQLLKADSAQTTGLVWGTLAHSATTGRTTDDHHAKAHDHTTADSSGVLTNDEHDGFSEYAELGADPSTPASNKIRVYCKDNGGVSTLYYRSDSGTVYELPTLSSGGGSGAPSNASYITLNSEAKLSSETVLGTGVIMAGVAASLPAASKAGKLYWTTDTYLLYRDTGAAWVEIARGEAAVRLAQLAEKSHASLSNVTANQHHNQAHTLDGADHTASGLTIGDVLTATGATTFAFQAPGAAGMAIQEVDGAPSGTFSTLKVSNGTLTDNGDGTATLVTGGAAGTTITVEEADGTPSVATVDTLKVPNGTLTDNADGSVTLAAPAHSQLTGVSADQHHTQAHTLTGADHTASGLTTGHVLKATGATTFGFGVDPATDLVTTKGDLLVATGADTLVRLAAGTNGQALLADSAQTEGVRWGTPSGTALTVTEEDGAPSVASVTEIRVSNGKLTDNGSGSVSLDLSGSSAGYTTVQDDGTSLTQRNTLNVRGRGIRVEDDGSSKTRLSIQHAPTMAFWKDDFTYGTNGELTWGQTGLTFTQLAPEANHPGIKRMATAASLNSSGQIFLTSSTVKQFVSSDLFDLQFILRYDLNSGAAGSTIAMCGIYAGSAGSPTDGCYFQKLDTDTNWFGVCRASSTETRSDMSVAFADTTWFRLRIRRDAAGGNVLFRINDGSDVSIGTNIPSVEVWWFAYLKTTEAVAKRQEVDYADLLVHSISR